MDRLVLSMVIYNRLVMTQSCIEMIQRHTDGRTVWSHREFHTPHLQRRFLADANWNGGCVCRTDRKSRS